MRHPAIALWALLASSCTDDVLRPTRGAVAVEARSVRLEATHVRFSLDAGSGEARAAEQAVEVEGAPPATTHRFEDVPVGLVTVRVQTLDDAGTLLDQVSVFPVAVAANEVTQVVVDFATGVITVAPPPDGTPGVCLDSAGDTEPARDVLCGRCTEPDGAIVAVPDDDSCGVISCDGLDRFRLEGDNTAAGVATCSLEDFGPITTDRCASVAVCRPADDPASCGPPVVTAVLEAGLCQTIANCAGAGPPSLVTAPDGTPCGTDRACAAGLCVTVDDPPPPPPAPVGCSDGAREGFLDVGTFPSIAACAGAFSVPGVTVPALAPQCDRAAGDDGPNTEGAGCSAADLCAAGWHVCQGKADVATRAPGGCADAVPQGTPDKALFFAVAQRSASGSVCDDASAGDNDVFGCGNLGTMLTADKNCGPLTRALASTAPNQCGFNEAEPPLGPWQCRGGSDSHLHEGALVTKAGCAGGSCSYDGQPIGNADKGGVLCCVD